MEAGCASPSKPVYDLSPGLTSPSINLLLSMANGRPDVFIGNTAERANHFASADLGRNIHVAPL
ncbi:hypothetical protein CaCOL14_005279 [Colletotrichum acutatum]